LDYQKRENHLPASERHACRSVSPDSTKEFTMDTIKFGLMLTVVPFIAIFLIITIWWALTDISVRKIKGPRRAMWTLLVILLPPLGSLLYTSLNRERDITPIA
jgi:hypothetical protein